MLPYECKTKMMVFNVSRTYQFLQDYTDDLMWNIDTTSIIGKANTSMEIVEWVAIFFALIKALKQIYNSFVRSLMEQSVAV